MKGLFQCPPWARGFCPFRACGAKAGVVLFLPFQGVWGKSRGCLISALSGRVGQKQGLSYFCPFRACCFLELLGLQPVLKPHAKVQ